MQKTVKGILVKEFVLKYTCFVQILGSRSEFHGAVDLVLTHVNFEQDNVVQIFEATIR